MYSTSILKFAATVLASTAALVATGCGLGGAPVVSSKPLQPSFPTSTGSGISGIAHGGYFPVSGATGNLWYPGVTGYGSSGGILATTTTLPGGVFQFGAYTCPASDMPLYIVITGGNPGLSTGTNNPYVALAGYIGPCQGASSLSGLVINEATTAALVFATAQFTSASQAGGVASGSQALSYLNGVTGTSALNGLNIGAPAGTLSGAPATLTVTNTLAYNNLKNAFKTALNLVNLSGTIGPQNATNIINDAIGPYSTPIKLAEIGNILASCVQSTGVGGVCASLADATGTSTTSVLPGLNGGASSIGCGGKTVTSTASGTATVSGTQTISSIAVATPGAGYGTLANVIISGGGGSGATATATISGGTITGYTVTNAGSGYTSAPTVIVTECSVPVDTMQIALYMALSPSTNVTNVFNTIPASSPYGATQANAPFDWTLGITYTGLSNIASGVGYGLEAPAIDANGNVWLPSTATLGLFGVNALGQPLNSGAVYGGGGGVTFSGVSQTVIDSSGNVWTANGGSAVNALVEFNPTATTYAQYKGSTSPTCGPSGLTLDPNFDFLYTCVKETSSPAYPLNGLMNSGATSAPIYSATSTVGNTGTGATAQVFQIASDTSGNIWVPLTATVSSVTKASVVEMSPNATLPAEPSSYTAGSPIQGGASATGGGLVIDHAGNVWFDGTTTNLSKLTAGTSTVTNYSGIAGGQVNSAYMAIDGAGDIWMANASGNIVGSSPNTTKYFTVSAFNNAGVAITPPSVGTSPITSPGGYPHDYGQPKFVAVDGSGNVWVPNYQAPAAITSYTITSGTTITLTGAGIAAGLFPTNAYITLYGFPASTFLNGLTILLGSSSNPAGSFSGTVVGTATLTPGSAVTENGFANIGSGIAPNLTEIVGASVPVYAPTGTAASLNKLGVLP